MSSLLFLFSRIYYFLFNKKNKIFRRRILSFTQDMNFHFLGYDLGLNIRDIDSFEEISWSDIFFRRVRVLTIPARRYAIKKQDKCKRFLLKWLSLSVKDDVIAQIFFDLLFSDHTNKLLVTNSHHVKEIYAAHLPNFKVLQMPGGRIPKKIMLLFAFICRNLKYKDHKTGLTVFANITSVWFLKTYRNLHPNRKIVFRLHDLLEQVCRSEKITKQDIFYLTKDLLEKGIINSVESYCLHDAQFLNATYRPNGVNPEFLAKYIGTYREFLYCFIGGENRLLKGITSREKAFECLRSEIIRIYPMIDRYCRFVIADLSGYWLPYIDFIRDYSVSEIYIDLLRVQEDEGYSFRIPEALWLNRKIISNRLNLLNEPFYSPDRIFLIGFDPIERLQTFLEQDIDPLPPSLLKFYDTRKWWTEFSHL